MKRTAKWLESVQKNSVERRGIMDQIRKGISDAQIARQYGISRERVRQLRNKLGLPAPRDVRAVQNRMKAQSLRIIYLNWQAEQRRRVCVVLDCKKLVRRAHPGVKYCPSHSKEIARYRYPFMTSAQRTRYRERQAVWRRQPRNWERYLKVCQEWRQRQRDRAKNAG